MYRMMENERRKDKDYVFDDADSLIAYLTKLARDKNNVFRGYGKQSELLPNIIREKDWSNSEIKLLHEFERYGLQYFSANNPIDFMSYAQHYGLPTRLLDFTYNPFIALYFSLFTPKGTRYTHEEDKLYYYIRYCSLKDQLYFQSLPYFDDTMYHSSSFAAQCNKMIALLDEILILINQEVETDRGETRAIVQYFGCIFHDGFPGEDPMRNSAFRHYIIESLDKFEAGKMLFVGANQCNQRIVMQQGLFMFPYVLDSDKHLVTIQNNTTTIKIHKDIRNELLDYLDTMGIDAFRLMPDLQNVCHAVKRKIIDGRMEESGLFRKKSS